MMAMGTLYERLGGDTAIMAAVEIFYDKVVADEVTRPFFSELDMAVQSKKMISFMAWAFDGPSEYRGRDLTRAHAGLVRDKGLSDVHFDAVAVHLRDTLTELDVADDVAQEVMTIVAGTREAVLRG